MQKNEYVRGRVLTEKEKQDMKKDVYDSFASYLTICSDCGYVDRSNMYLMRARERLVSLEKGGNKCPVCGKTHWELGYPDNTTTGFVHIKK